MPSPASADLAGPELATAEPTRTELASADPACAELASEVWAAMRAFVADQDRHEELARVLGLGRGRGRLKALRAASARSLTLRELAEAIGVDPPYATVVVDSLESAGLVRREPHPLDGRRKLVTPTPAGLVALATAEAFLAQPPEPLAALDAEALRQLQSVLARLSPAASVAPGERGLPGVPFCS